MNLKRLAQVLMAIGILGFLGTFELPRAGSLLDRFELPAMFETTTLALPDGGRITATMPTQRVQHYGSDGRFLNGWFVDAKGGHFGIGLTTQGQVLVCTGRGRQFFVFDLDGHLAGPAQDCMRVTPPRDVPRVLQPDDLAGQASLARAATTSPPPVSFLAFALVPFWHPFVAWAIGLFGYLVLRSGSWKTPSPG